MTAKSNNPFVLPGLGQAPDLAGNPLLASMEMMRQAWAGLAGPGGLAQAVPGSPSSTQELERRIAELRAVENWLKLNLSMLSSTIQGLEVQRATIATLRAFVGSMGGAQGPGEASPLEVALGIKPGGVSTATVAGDAGADDPAQAPEPVDPAPQGPGGAPAGAPGEGASQRAVDAGMQAMGAAAQSASEAWWKLLQQQFGQLASATAATMPPAPGAAAPGAAAPATGEKPSRARKPAGARKAAKATRGGKGAKPAS